MKIEDKREDYNISAEYIQVGETFEYENGKYMRVKDFGQCDMHSDSIIGANLDTGDWIYCLKSELVHPINVKAVIEE